jgi:glycosyltransferase involved in cell wall biosynthesis
MVDIVVIRTANSIVYDPRVTKIVGSLSRKYSMTVLGWNRDGISQEKINNYTVNLELFKLKTSFWKPSLIRIIIRLIIFFPPFWTWVFIKLLASRPKIVHACDLDTIIPSYIYKILFRKKLVFDVFDRYAMALIPPRFKKLSSAINYFEELVSERSDLLVIAGGDEVLRSFHRKPKYCEILLNCPRDYFRNSTKIKPKLDDHNFKVVYTGGIRTDRSLENIMQAIRDLDKVNLLVAGPVIDIQVLQLMEKFPNVKYKGLLQPNEALSLEACSNVLVALYNPDILWNKITLPNKLFEAMMCGVPIITNIATDVVSQTDCGLIVEYDNVEQIKHAIVTLRDNPELCKRLGDNGRKAFLEKYNWDIMEQRLYNAYQDLLSNKAQGSQS